MFKKILSCMMVVAMLVTMVSVTAFAEGEKYWEEANSREEGSIVQSYDQIYFINYLSKELDIKIKVFQDLECEKLIDEDGDGYTSVITVPDINNENGNGIEYFLPVNGTFRIDSIQDDTGNTDDPSVTYVLHDVYAELSDAQKAELRPIENSLNDILNSCDESYTQELLNPVVLNIDGWTEETAKNFAYSHGTISTLTGLDWTLKVDDVFVSLDIKYYADSECKEQVDIENIRVGEVYYIKPSYSFNHNVGDFDLNHYIYRAKPIKYTVTYTTRIDENSPEVSKIRENVNIDISKNSIVYDDLAWTNILAYTGQDALAPSIKNAGAILNERNSELYDTLVGNTDLEIALSYGGAGGGGVISHAVFDVTAIYTVDGILCFNGAYMKDEDGASLAWMPIYMSKVMYVPKGIDAADERAKAAEDRIKNYMGASDYKVEIEALDKIELKTYGLNNQRIAGSVMDLDWNPIDLSDAKAAYLTEYGIAFYSAEDSTSEEDFIGICGFPQEDVLALKNVDADGTVDYIKIEERDWNDELGEEEDKVYSYENVKTYQAYTLTLGGDDEQTYFYIIGTKTPAEIDDLDKNSFANWEDKDTGIITEGENGQVVGDFYTKIHRTSDGDIEVIKKELKGNVGDVDAYDIAAFTNFKEGQITDLGDGRVQIMVPFDAKKMDKDNLKVFYYNDNSKKVEEELPFELLPNADDPEYVCFTVSHFSTYGIAEVSDDSSGGADNEGTVGGNDNTGNAGNSGKTEINKDSEADTGDDSNMMIAAIAGLLALAAFGTTMVVRRRN